ncbi:MAG: glycogen/starch synthase [bacterium]
MSKFLKIASISSQVAPYSKTGGLGDVARSLPKAFKKLGHQSIVITPFYEQIIDAEKYNLRKIAEEVVINIDKNNKQTVDFWEGILDKTVKIYFIGNKKFFSRHKHIYGSGHENARFLLFDLACIKLLRFLNYSPDVIQCHDWHTGLAPYLIQKRYSNDILFKKSLLVYTIHILTFQFGKDWWTVPLEHKDYGRNGIPEFNDLNLEYVNFAKRGILNADIITTVSEQYASEILTKKFGEDLHIILVNRKNNLYGIINGIDYDDYNPATDPGLIRNYNMESIDKKLENKFFLQKKFGLPENKDIPLIAMVTRITEQKGFDLIFKIIEPMMRLDLQVVIMGGGDKNYEMEIKKICKKYPSKCAAHLEFDQENATQVYAGSDMILMPSRFEPCGLNQMISIRYGSIPIVHATGGLVDTITDFNPKTWRGNGFVFDEYNDQDLLMALTRAVETYKHKEIWRRLVLKAMEQSFSWELPARKYIKLFRKALKEKKEKKLEIGN